MTKVMREGGKPEVQNNLFKILSKMTVHGSFGDCWEWSSKSYGQISLGVPYKISAHRASYFVFKGDATEKVVRHSCDNPKCFNPDHLDIGTTKDNIQDQIKRGRHRYSNYTHCNHGHEYTEENTYITPKGHRQCRICKKRRKDAWKSRQMK